MSFSPLGEQRLAGFEGPLQGGGKEGKRKGRKWREEMGENSARNKRVITALSLSTRLQTA